MLNMQQDIVCLDNILAPQPSVLHKRYGIHFCRNEMLNHTAAPELCSGRILFTLARIFLLLQPCDSFWEQKFSVKGYHPVCVPEMITFNQLYPHLTDSTNLYIILFQLPHKAFLAFYLHFLTVSPKCFLYWQCFLFQIRD